MELIREYGALRLALRVAVAGLVLGGIVYLSRGQISVVSLRRIVDAFALIDWHDWLGAGVATAVSFWAIGRFDVVVHRHMATGVAPHRAARAGQAGVAFGQCLGLTFLTGAILRMRCLPELGARRALRLSVFASAAFMASHLVLCGLLAPMLWPAASWISVATMFCLFVLAVILFFANEIRALRPFSPSIPACWSMLFYATLDTLTAGIALYLLLPDGLPFGQVYAAYLFALFGGLMIGVPGAAGALEVGFIALIAPTDLAPVVTGLIAFRMIYFALPALLAAGVALRRTSPPAPRHGPEVFTASPARAEQWLLAQGDSETLRVEDNWGGAVVTPQTLSLYLGPLKGQLAPLLKPLVRAARDQNRFALLYRVSATHAQEARSAGWSAIPIADEALIETDTYSTKSPARRQLRRALRKADISGLCVAEETGIPPFKAMAQVNTEWMDRHGKERGVTMGRYSQTSVLGQRLFIARDRSGIVAFVTFHHLRNEWCLDLMRHTDTAPSGTMHALLHAAIGVAKTEKVPIVSLATVPVGPGFLIRRSAGLRRFKTSFGPVWRKRYLCAPNIFALLIGGMDLLRAVFRPPAQSNAPHVSHENNEFASRRRLWDTRAESSVPNQSQACHGKSAQNTSRVA